MSRQDDLIEANNRGLLTGKVKEDFDMAVERGIITLPISETTGIPQEQPEEFRTIAKTAGREAFQTVEDIGKVYPAIETGLNMITSAYGIPASGLGGLATLFATGDLGKADKAIKKIQEGLVYLPQTEEGERLTRATAYPFEQIERGAEYAGGEVERLGYPNVAATVHSAISSAPVLAGGKMAMGKVSGKPIAAIGKELSSAIKKGVNKAVRPSVVKKSTSSQVKRYFDQAESAITEIVKNKDNLNIIDETGAKVEGLPKTLDQFSQAIEQTKRSVFEEYDALAKETGGASVKRELSYPLRKGEKVVFDEVGKGTAVESPVTIDLGATAKKLDPTINNKIFNDFSPETVEYAKSRMESLKGREKYSAVEAQEGIQMLNQTLEQFYRDPSPQMKGRAYVDALIANDLRKQLDSVIERTTGKEYQSLKKKYGDLKAIESDVTKRSIVDARKNNKGLIDFSDIFSGHQIIKGMMAKDPVSIAAGTGAKGLSKYYKMLNDPNRIVKKMFSDVDKLYEAKNVSNVPPPIGQPPINIQGAVNSILERFNKGDFSPEQVAAFDELRKRGAL